LSANFRWKGTSLNNCCWYQNTRVFLLPRSEDRVIICSFMWIGYQRVTDRRRDRQNYCRYAYYSALHCKQCGRAVKTGMSNKTGIIQAILKRKITITIHRIPFLPVGYVDRKATKYLHAHKRTLEIIKINSTATK